MKYTVLKPHQRIAAVYLIAATLWILFSDTLLYTLIGGNSVTTRLSVAKGLMFVTFTAGVLYLHLRWAFTTREQLEGDLRLQMQHAQRTQTDLQHSEARFRRAVEEAPLPTAIFAEDGELLTVSRSWLDVTGYSRDQLQTVSDWVDLAYGEDRERIMVGVDRLFELDQRLDEGEFTIRVANGTQRIWTFSTTPLGRLPDGRRIVISTAADVTERRHTEQQLRIKDRAIESSITAIALADMQGELTYVNPAFLRLWKLDATADMLGRPVTEFWVSSADAEAVVQTLTERDDYVGELRARLADGTQADIQLTASLVRDADGHPVCMMGSFIDVTLENQARAHALENERLKAGFQKEQERNELVQRIISMLSHDLRTPLTVIESSKDLLLNYANEMTLESRRNKLEGIGRQVHFALELLQDTVNMARGTLDKIPFRPAPVNIVSLCQVSADEVPTAYENAPPVTFVNQTPVDTVVVDEVLVSRILLNLLSNAIKYSPDGNEIRLELVCCHDNWLVLRVVDYGMGIDAEDLKNIFEPFFRAKGVNQIHGTGLGLSIVKDCVERHQGRIHVESEVGQGSTFTVELPLQTVGQRVPELA